MKRHRFAFFLWMLFWLALLALGVYVLWNSAAWEPERLPGIFPLVEGWRA